MERNPRIYTEKIDKKVIQAEEESYGDEKWTQ